MCNAVLALQAEVSSEQAEALSRDLNLRFYRACVKDNLNVSEGMSHDTEVAFMPVQPVPLLLRLYRDQARESQHTSCINTAIQWCQTAVQWFQTA